jgi:hypothetical protein
MALENKAHFEVTRAPFVQADATRLPFADGTFDLCFTSPPYLEARLYLEDGKNPGVSRKCAAWVDWMVEVVRECCRVTKGLVIVNCAGTTRQWRYNPGPEGLLWKWWEQGGECWRPAYWKRVGIPGSGGKQWLRADIEYLLAFKQNPGQIPWADNLACGHPPKWAPGGAMSHRVSNGRRVNQWGGSYDPESQTNAKDANGKPTKKFRPSHQVIEHAFGNPASTSGRRPNGDAKPIYMNGAQAGTRKHTKRLADGTMEEQTYTVPVLANPGNVVEVIVGGGVMGHPLAHENEAPFPEKLPEFFIKSFCQPGGRVLDPFSGSGTTVAVAQRLGRIGYGCDLRMSQCELGRRRLATPFAKKTKAKKAVPEPKGEPLLWGAA